MKKREAFTLIELIAVLVILAILALIVTPLVLNIIKKARTAADKRSIDAYGRSIELAIADYLLDNGSLPTSIEQLQVEYTGDEVVCSTTSLKSDSSIYLAECTVGGRTVSEYTYGKEEIITYKSYTIGDEVTYNDIDYYVIKNSDEKDASVTLLKATPLTYEEVQTYSAGTGAEISNVNGYGGMQYSNYISGITPNDYSTSYIKKTLDSWGEANILSNDIDVDETGYSIRLITYDELMENLGFEYRIEGTSTKYTYTDQTPTWVYNSDYYYWTMSPAYGSTDNVFYVSNSGILYGERANNSDPATGRVSYTKRDVVRPVITLLKSALWY